MIKFKSPVWFWKFYDFIGAGGCRFMCSWATSDADVDAFLADARRCAEAVR
jgi:threonine aldolase